MAMGFSNTRTLTVEWGDCDPADIVFYPRFFAMFDTSTTMLIEAAAGCRKMEIIRRFGIIGWPMVDTRGKFHAPATFGDEVNITSAIARVGRASFEIEHRLSVGNRLCVEGWETRVWSKKDIANPGAIVSEPIDPELRTRLQGDLSQ